MTKMEHEKRDLERFAKNIDAWAEDGKRWSAGDAGDDQETAETYERDVLALRDIYAAVRQGNYPKAARLAHGLDSIVRDQIPAKLYIAINQ